MRFSAPLIGVLVALVLTAAFWFLLYKPASDQQAVVETEIAALEGEQRTLETQIAQLREVESRQVEIRAEMARLEEFIPVGAAQPTAIRQFQRAADAAGTEITTLAFSEPEVPDAATGATPADTGIAGTTLANIPITLTVEGGYFQIVDFFRRVEVDVPRAALVQTVDVVEEADEGFPTLAATWTGQLFAVVPLGDLVDTAAGVPAPTATPTPAPTEGGES